MIGGHSVKTISGSGANHCWLSAGWASIFCSKTGEEIRQALKDSGGLGLTVDEKRALSQLANDFRTSWNAGFDASSKFFNDPNFLVSVPEGSEDAVKQEAQANLALLRKVTAAIFNSYGDKITPGIEELIENNSIKKGFAENIETIFEFTKFFDVDVVKITSGKKSPPDQAEVGDTIDIYAKCKNSLGQSLLQLNLLENPPDPQKQADPQKRDRDECWKNIYDHLKNRPILRFSGDHFNISCSKIPDPTRPASS